MKTNFDAALAHVLVHEGGFVDHPQDPGGATNKGVTLMTFQRFFGAERTVEELRAITNEQLGKIYRTGYWDACRCDQLPDGVDYCVFDAAVNSGPRRSIRWLEGALGKTENGIIDNETVAAAGQTDAVKLIDAICDKRMAFLRSLRTFATFGRGWTRRVEGVRSVAKAMAGQAPASESAHTQMPPLLRRGASGDLVTQLQEALGVAADGKFGSGTEKALRAFQNSHGLEVDGIAGPASYRALGMVA